MRAAILDPQQSIGFLQTSRSNRDQRPGSVAIRREFVLPGATRGSRKATSSISTSTDTANNFSDLQQQLHRVTDNSGYASLSTNLGFTHGN
jgi:hypothetical protein